MASKLGIYTPLGMDGHELCQPIDQDDFEQINLLIDGSPRQISWKPIQMRIVQEDEGKDLVRSDSPWLGSHALIFRSSVVDELGLMLRQYGELLPVSCPDVDLSMYNVTNVIDALDERASSVLRFNDGKIMMIQRHVFQTDMIGNADIFKIPNLRVSPTFLSQRFVDQWKARDLKGLEFKRVWTATD